MRRQAHEKNMSLVGGNALVESGVFESPNTVFLVCALQVALKLEDLEETLQKPVVDNVTEGG